MRDKQIIIDGVDVSKCRYFLKDTEGQDYDTDEFVKGCCEAKGSCIGYEFAGYGLCRGDKDCYFKQLARKTQECEELEELLKLRTNDRIDKLERAIIRRNAKIDRYHKALDEIEKATKINCEEICGRKFEDCNDTSCFSAELLNIINKARG